MSPHHAARFREATRLGKAQGCDVVAIAVAGRQFDYQWQDSKFQSVHWQYCTLFPQQDYWRLSYRRIHRSLFDLLNQIKPDVVVLPGWGFKESLAGLSWCFSNRKPRVVISDSQRADHAFQFRWLKRLLVNRFQAALVAGTRHVSYLGELGFPVERCFPGCDVVDNDFFAGENSRWRATSQCRGSILLSCLRFIKVKNIPATIHLLARREHPWHWLIAGSGPGLQEVVHLIDRLGVQDKVCLLGHIDYPDLPRLYAQADAYLQPSLSDTWGLAVNEAMACGLPVIVSRQCGCSEDLVDEGENGFAFDAASPESLVEALDRLWKLKPRWKDMGERSKEIISGWGLDRFARSFWDSCRAALSVGASTNKQDACSSRAAQSGSAERRSS